MSARQFALAPVAAVAVSLLVAVPCDARRGEPQGRRRTIETTGSARLVSKPDRVRIVLAVETRGQSAESATQKNAAKSSKVMTRLKTLLGRSGKLSSRAYDLRPEYEYSDGQPRRRELVGYIARSTIEIDSANLDAAGKVIDVAVNAGANAIQSVSFYLESDDELRREALVEAGRKARDKAEAIAESLRVDLGKLVHATSAQQTPGPVVPMMSRALSADAKVPTEIEPGEVEVRMTVHAVFEIR